MSRFRRLHAFQACLFSHSSISPYTSFASDMSLGFRELCGLRNFCPPHKTTFRRPYPKSFPPGEKDLPTAFRPLTTQVSQVIYHWGFESCAACETFALRTILYSTQFWCANIRLIFLHTKELSILFVNKKSGSI